MEQPFQLTVDVDLELYEQLSLAAAQRGISLSDFCVEAIEELLSPEKAIGPDPVL